MRDLTGQRFGRLVVLQIGQTLAGYVHWRVRCDCGVEKEVRTGNLTSGQIVSCGCKKRGRRDYPPPPPVPGARWIPLANGPFTLVDEQDYPLLNNYLWRVAKGYAVRTNSSGVMVALHREILNPPPDIEVDHRNRDRLDNRRNNLRLATRDQNAKNASKPASNTSGAKGVTWDAARKRWKVQIRIKDQRIWLGRFTDYVAAMDAYNNAAKAYHGDFACIDKDGEPAPSRNYRVMGDGV